MTLTVEQALAAGAIAKQIGDLQVAMATAQTAAKGGVTLSTVSAQGTSGDVSGISGAAGVSLSANIAMTAEESATILNALVAVYQGKLDALNAQLAAITA